MNLNPFLREIRSRKKWILGACFAVGLISSVYYMINPVKHSSTVVFMVDEKTGDKSDVAPLIISEEASPAGNRLYHLAKSTEMTDHLIGKFDLYRHYGVSKNDSLAYETVVDLIRSGILVSPVKSEAMAITVEDYDRDFAAAVANEIFSELDRISKKEAVSYLEKRIGIYQQTLSETSHEFASETKTLGDLIAEYRQLPAAKTGNDAVAFGLNMKLSALSEQLVQVNKDMQSAVKNYEMALTGLRNDNLPSIRIVSKALRDLHPPTIITAVIQVTLNMIVAALCSCIAVLLLFQYRSQLADAFRNEPVLRELFEKSSTLN